MGFAAYNSWVGEIARLCIRHSGFSMLKLIPRLRPYAGLSLPGWVSLKVKDKPMVAKTDRTPPAEPAPAAPAAPAVPPAKEPAPKESAPEEEEEQEGAPEAEADQRAAADHVPALGFCRWVRADNGEMTDDVFNALPTDATLGQLDPLILPSVSCFPSGKPSPALRMFTKPEPPRRRWGT